jgi:hydrogenase/urease accessory protein HupE
LKWVMSLLLFLLAVPTWAHEVRPAYLELTQTSDTEFAVLWKLPMRGELRLALTPVFSGDTTRRTPIVSREQNGAAVQTWQLHTGEPLRGQSVRIEGLENTMTDALVRISFADGSQWVKRLTPAEAQATIPQQPDGSSVIGDYFTLGVEHILLGIDHLLFVLALLILVRGTWQLVKTITAFTVAHSITLALATLGFVHVPSAPVEAVIALSIVFVAMEIIRAREGRAGITANAPWIVAFTFGLLHGFGFAGVLSEIGLPANHIPLALLFFNIGVEAGQLLFIALMLCFMGVLHWTKISFPRWVILVPPYAIGSVAIFWVLQRVAAF